MMSGDMELDHSACMIHEDQGDLSFCSSSLSTVDTSLITDAYENDEFWLPSATESASNVDDMEFTSPGNHQNSNQELNIGENLEANAHQFSTVHHTNTSIQYANHQVAVGATAPELLFEGQRTLNQPSQNLYASTSVFDPEGAGGTDDSMIYNVFDVAIVDVPVQTISHHPYSINRDAHLSTNMQNTQQNSASTDMINQRLDPLQPNQPALQQRAHAVYLNEGTSSDPDEQVSSLDYEPVPFHLVVPNENHRERVMQTTMPTGGMTSQSFSTLRPICKPLSAYNYFFRFERERLLKVYEVMDCGSTTNEKPVETFESLSSLLLDSDLPSELRDHFKWTIGNSVAAQCRLLQDQWSRDPCRKRKHSKSEDKRIPFEILARLVAKSWNDLPSPVKDVFDEIAYRDKERYQCELAWNTRQQQMLR